MPFVTSSHAPFSSRHVIFLCFSFAVCLLVKSFIVAVHIPSKVSAPLRSNMLIAHPCKPPGRLSCFISYLSGQTFLEFQEVILSYQPALLEPSSHQDFIPWHSSRQTPEEMEVDFCVIQGCGLDFCLPISF